MGAALGLGDLAKHALEMGAGLFGSDLAHQVGESLELRGIVGWRLGFAGHVEV